MLYDVTKKIVLRGGSRFSFLLTTVSRKRKKRFNFKLEGHSSNWWDIPKGYVCSQIVFFNRPYAGEILVKTRLFFMEGNSGQNCYYVVCEVLLTLSLPRAFAFLKRFSGYIRPMSFRDSIFNVTINSTPRAQVYWKRHCDVTIFLCWLAITTEIWCFYDFW